MPSGSPLTVNASLEWAEWNLSLPSNGWWLHLAVRLLDGPLLFRDTFVAGDDGLLSQGWRSSVDVVETEVLVVGAGPVGATLGLLLTDLGVSAVKIERWQLTSTTACRSCLARGD